MSYNLFFKFNKKIDWVKLHESISNNKVRYLEFVPVDADDDMEGDSLAVSIPSKNICDEMWPELVRIINLLFLTDGTRGYDLITGKEIHLSYLDILKRNLFV